MVIVSTYWHNPSCIVIGVCFQHPESLKTVRYAHPAPYSDLRKFTTHPEALSQDWAEIIMLSCEMAGFKLHLQGQDHLSVAIKESVSALLCGCILLADVEVVGDPSGGLAELRAGSEELTPLS